MYTPGNSSGGTKTSPLGVTDETTTSNAPSNHITPTTAASLFPPGTPTSLDASPSTQGSPSTQDSSGSNATKNNIGKVAGIVIGVIVLLFILLCCVMATLRIKNRRAMVAARRRGLCLILSCNYICLFLCSQPIRILWLFLLFSGRDLERRPERCRRLPGDGTHGGSCKRACFKFERVRIKFTLVRNYSDLRPF